MQITKKLKLSSLALAGAVALTSLAGCSTLTSTDRTNKEIGQINFDYTVPKQQPATGKLIAIVAPDFTNSTAKQPEASNPLLALAMAQQGAVVAPVDFNANFNTSYKAQLNSALQNTFNEIISKQGFRTAEYPTFDDMTYTEKRDTYLASVPKLNLVIDKKLTKDGCSGGVCVEEGTIQITGELNVSLIEPLTSQTFINRRINLSSLNIAENYIIQRDNPNPQGVAGIINSVTKPAEYQDNTDKALVNALNRFYKQAAERIAQYISREEMLSLEKDIVELKGTKRY